jgi:hypothetical protein
MRQRCNSPGNPGYRIYGAKGVKVCNRWDKFETFLADMGDRPEGTSLDRIDSNGNYEPENCRWATKLQQNRNTSRVRLTEEICEAINAYVKNYPNSKRQLRKELSVLLGLNVATIADYFRGRTWKEFSKEILDENNAQRV